LGRADLRLRFSGGICSPLPIEFGCMCAHSFRADGDGDGDGDGDVAVMVAVMVIVTVPARGRSSVPKRPGRAALSGGF